MAGDPVDLGTGLYVRSHDDIVQAGEPAIRFRRTYRNADTVRQIINDDQVYRFDYQMADRRRIRETEVTVPDGRRYRVTFDSDGVPASTVYEPGTPEETQVLYEREPVTRHLVAMSVRCAWTSAGVSRVTLERGESKELVEARLRQACRLGGIPSPGR